MSELTYRVFDKAIDCGVCQGHGRLYRGNYNRRNSVSLASPNMKCPACKGSGSLPAGRAALEVGP